MENIKQDYLNPLKRVWERKAGLADRAELRCFAGMGSEVF